MMFLYFNAWLGAVPYRGFRSSGRVLYWRLVTVQTPPPFTQSENDRSMTYAQRTPDLVGGSERLRRLQQVSVFRR